MSARDSYWHDALVETLDAMGIHGRLSNAELQGLAESLAVSHENYAIAAGYDAIPNPLESTLHRQKREAAAELERIHAQHANEQAERDEALRRWRRRALEAEEKAGIEP